jgi:hypothetical protein
VTSGTVKAALVALMAVFRPLQNLAPMRLSCHSNTS